MTKTNKSKTKFSGQGDGLMDKLFWLMYENVRTGDLTPRTNVKTRAGAMAAYNASCRELCILGASWTVRLAGISKLLH